MQSLVKSFQLDLHVYGIKNLRKLVLAIFYLKPSALDQLVISDIGALLLTGHIKGHIKGLQYSL